MSDALSNPQTKYQIDAHVWIGAFAIAQIVMAVVFLYRIDALGAAVDSHQKLEADVASMQQEIQALRQICDASKPEPAKKDGAVVPTQSQSVHGRGKN